MPIPVEPQDVERPLSLRDGPAPGSCFGSIEYHTSTGNTLQLALDSDRPTFPIQIVDILCRYGGEAFAILLPKIDPEQTHAAGARLCKLIGNRLFETSVGKVSITVCIGVATVRGEDETRGWLLDHADQALYAAKRAGKNQVTSFAPLEV